MWVSTFISRKRNVPANPRSRCVCSYLASGQKMCQWTKDEHRHCDELNPNSCVELQVSLCDQLRVLYRPWADLELNPEFPFSLPVARNFHTLTAVNLQSIDRSTPVPPQTQPKDTNQLPNWTTFLVSKGRKFLRLQTQQTSWVCEKCESELSGVMCSKMVRQSDRHLFAQTCELRSSDSLELRKAGSFEFLAPLKRTSSTP